MLRDAYEILGAATLVLAAFYALRARPFDRTRFSLVAGLGTIYLALDEALDVHERLGKAAFEAGWPDPPIVNHYDDLLLMVGALGAAAVAACFYREILRERFFAALFGAGLALFAGGIVVDARADPTRTLSWWTEETIELAGCIAMAAAFRWRLQFATTGPESTPGEVASLPTPAATGDLSKL